MALEINTHVARLRRFQPFHPDSAELIYEQSDPKEAGFETVALGHIEAVVEDPTIRLIVLTGDAGHGKTSLCARLLERLGSSPVEAAALIRSRGDGSAPLATTRSGRPLRILKDLSDVTVEPGASLLAELLAIVDTTISIVCANEGRLRRAVASHPDDELRVLTLTLERGMSDGSLASVDPAVHVVNLNFQSVAPDSRSGLVDWALRSWGADRRRWHVCARCDASAVCPIYANHHQLAADELGETRREGVRALFATAERSGAVITTRQALATVAFTITGGLQCTDVHRRWRRGPTDAAWQFPYLFHQALFADRLSRDQRNHVPAFDALRRLDPGAVALRAVDDSLEPTVEDPPFLPPVPVLDEGTPRSRRDAQRESETLRQLMRFLRRRDFFDGGASTPLLARMGLKAGDAFERAARTGAHDAVAIRDELLRGLEAVQGVHRAGQPPDFLVLDPAFVTHRSRAAVVAKRIQSRVVRVVPQIEHWRLMGNDDPDLPTAVDWLDRVAFLRIEDPASAVAVSLDLFRFELLCRWAAGLSSRIQHEAEIRHLSGALSQLVPSGDYLDEITVLVGGERRTLTIDVGERVRSGEG